MSFCTNCGKPIDEKAKFCPECGAKQNISAEETATVTEEVAVAASQNVAENAAPVEGQASNKFCTYCGGSVHKDAVICVHCGCKIEAKEPAVESKKNCGFAIAGFVLSLLVPILGLIFSCLAMNKIKKEPYLAGKGFAVAGIIISIATMVLNVIMNLIQLMSYV